MAAPRPLIYTRSPGGLRVDQPYEYRAATIRSIGDLRCRTIKDKGVYNAAFWDEEHPEWSLAQAPEWLTVDAATGVAGGSPPAPGNALVELVVTIPGVGEARQRFSVEVAAK